MGVVYTATRADGARDRTVALKLVHAGHDSAEVLRRFQEEQRILASLEHPNIARLCEAGRAGDGRPYLVMEYVSGRPIHAYCEERALDTARRIGLYLQVPTSPRHTADLAGAPRPVDTRGLSDPVRRSVRRDTPRPQWIFTDTTMPRVTRALAAGTACATLSLSLAACDSEVRSENAVAGDDVQFQVDRQWPQPFPANWVPGDVTGIAVDGRDHAWVLTPPDSLTTEERAAGVDDPIRLPTVVELDPVGRVVQTWPVPTGELAWPVTPHGIFVDHTEHVWVGYRDDHRVVKFTRAGDHVLTIGEKDVTGGSNDPDRLGAPAGIWVDPETNEVYVADGYRNRRIVVYDGETGAYLRHWGAYGERPDDSYVFDPEVEGDAPARQFSTAHGITGSRDGSIYLADRRNGRVQVFGHEGAFIEERILPPTEGETASIYDVALSNDDGQRLVFVADGNGKVWILQRDGLDVVGEIGSPGREAGQFTTPHNLAMDARGVLHVADAQGRRVQRFRPGG